MEYPVKFLILRHAIACPNGDECNYPNCMEYKVLARHIENCKDTDCKRENCKKCKDYFNFWVRRLNMRMLPPSWKRSASETAINTLMSMRDPEK